ncbi:MAG TPA: DUF4350 domain-containing protein [Gemmataceae bacterium]|nr:DUF4350 domain-containing protein [Gemmataceae bacterium]
MSNAAAQPTAESQPPARPRPSSFFNWLLILLLVSAFGALTYWVLREGAEAGQGLPAYSVYADDARGLAQAAAVVGRFGWQPIAVTRPIQGTRARGLLILVEPSRADVLGRSESGMSDDDVRGLLRWVGNGNALLFASRERTPLHDKLQVFLGGGPRDDTPRTVEQIEFSGYTEDVEALEVEGRATVEGGGAVPLWWIGDRPGALLVPHGKGRVLVLPDPSLLTHRGLLRRDNVLLLSNVVAREARDGKVYFDEYHHGIRSGGGAWGYLRFHHQHASVLLLFAALAVAVWGVAVRLGPAVPAPVESTADAVDYASAVARIYQKAGVRHLLADLIVRDFLGRLTAHLRLRRSAAPAEIVAVWRRRHPGGESRERLEELLRGAAELRQSAQARQVSEAELLAWARGFDEFINEAKATV